MQDDLESIKLFLQDIESSVSVKTVVTKNICTQGILMTFTVFCGQTFSGNFVFGAECVEAPDKSFFLIYGDTKIERLLSLISLSTLAKPSFFVEEEFSATAIDNGLSRCDESTHDIRGITELFVQIEKVLNSSFP